MAMTADSSSSHHSPRASAFSGDSSSSHHSPRVSAFSGDGVSSPQFGRRNLPSPWAQVVRGESESITAVLQSSPSSSSLPRATSVPEKTSISDIPAAQSSPPPENSAAAENSDGNNSNAARRKKLAWNKPSNSVVETGPVMGADSWPALSESTRASPKSSAPDSSAKAPLDGSDPTPQGPVIPHSPQKQTGASANYSSTPNQALPVRQRSMKRGGGISPGSGPSQSGFPRPLPPPPPPPFPVFHMPLNSYGNLIPAIPNSSPRERPYTRPAAGFVSQAHVVNDRPRNFGPHNNYGGRRDQERGNFINGRDNHMQSHRSHPRGVVRAPPPNNPQPVRPFATPMGFVDMKTLPYTAMEPFRGVPFITRAPPPPPLFIPVAEPPLPIKIINQIDYYFSDKNLIDDKFLKSNMDDQGWVPITLIAGFHRVKNLTNNIHLILDSLRNSTVVEVQDDKVRRRNEWMKWIPDSGRLPSESGLPSPGGLNYNALATSFQNITMEEELAGDQNIIRGNTSPHLEAVLGRGSSESSG